MSTVTHIYDAIDRLAPFWLTMDFDNTGILIGDRNREVSCALLALDCTPAVVEQARQLGAQLIITHHPVIFHPLKRVNEDAVVYQLIRSDIAVISAHTNLDIAQGGVNDALASAIGLRDCRGLELLNEQTGAWLGRIGTLPEPLFQPREELERALHVPLHLGPAAYAVGAGAQVLLDAQFVEDKSSLGRHVDPQPGYAACPSAPYLAAAKSDAAGGGLYNAAYRPERRGLAGAVCAEQRDYAALVNVHVDVAHSLDGAVIHAEVTNFKQFHQITSSSSAPRYACCTPSSFWMTAGVP